MDLIDAVIIYLALGAPVGALHYISRARSGPGALATSGLAAMAWIFYLPRLLHTRVESKLNKSLSSELNRTKRLNRIARKLSAATLQTATRANLFEIREMLERYDGLSESLSQAENRAGIQTDFWSAAGNPVPENAAIIHSRSNLAKLKLHREDAAKELTDLSSKLDRQTADGKKAIEALAELFIDCDDPDLANLIIKGKTSTETGSSEHTIPGRMIWNASQARQRGNGPMLSLNNVTLSPDLRSDD